VKSIFGITFAFLYLAGPTQDGLYLPKKGQCPFKDGIMKKLTAHKGIVVGPGESTVDIWGTDSIVRSATNGRVTDVIYIQSMKYISIRHDTTIYTYADIDRALVQEGQQVTAGQPIAIAGDGRIEFFVSNYLGRILRHPGDYVDCVCELPVDDKVHFLALITSTICPCANDYLQSLSSPKK
jgi:hypothetical protein